MRAGLLLVIAGARAAPELVVEVEVNGKMQELRASPSRSPAAEKPVRNSFADLQTSQSKHT